MLVKAHQSEYNDLLGWLHEDMGIDRGTHIDFMMWGRRDKTANLAKSLSPVVALHFLWVHKDAHIKCKLAVTQSEKIAGLQAYSSIGFDEGLYFPYPGGADVSFHQGKVKYPLDIMFIRNDELVDCVQYTKVGSRDKWSCSDCDGVLEVNGGWMAENGAKIGDKLAWFANSEQDLVDYEAEKRAIASGADLFGEVAYRLFN